VSDLPDFAFVAAAYGVILTAVGVYAFTLARRLRAARAAAAPPEDAEAADTGDNQPA